MRRKLSRHSASVSSLACVVIAVSAVPACSPRKVAEEAAAQEGEKRMLPQEDDPLWFTRWFIRDLSSPSSPLFAVVRETTAGGQSRFRVDEGFSESTIDIPREEPYASASSLEELVTKLKQLPSDAGIWTTDANIGGYTLLDGWIDPLTPGEIRFLRKHFARPRQAEGEWVGVWKVAEIRERSRDWMAMQVVRETTARGQSRFRVDEPLSGSAHEIPRDEPYMSASSLEELVTKLKQLPSDAGILTCEANIGGYHVYDGWIDLLTPGEVQFLRKHLARSEEAPVKDESGRPRE